ncbi:hypothetical protein J6590_107081 [Homalodisca vitripennis]|nr:hypothetical protein J6590_107081 [Homalodisca vitripennis]
MPVSAFIPVPQLYHGFHIASVARAMFRNPNDSDISLFREDDADDDPDFVLKDIDKFDNDANKDAVPGLNMSQLTRPGILLASVALQRIIHIKSRFGKIDIYGSLHNQSEEAVLQARNVVVPGAKGRSRDSKYSTAVLKCNS